MKKILSLVLMMFVAVTLWAKPVVLTANLGGEKYDLITDDEYRVLTVDGHSDYEIVKIMKDCFPAEIGGKRYEYVDSVFSNITNEVAKKYPQYLLISEDRSYIFVDQALSDGRMIRLVFYLTN